MKRLFSMMAIVGLIAVSNCSRIPENNDPVLGIWVKTEQNNQSAKEQSPSISEEWIFNDVYLGRYHRYSEGGIVFQTDFSWKVSEDSYTISYSQGGMSPVQVSLKQAQNNEQLQLKNGDVFATRK